MDFYKQVLFFYSLQLPEASAAGCAGCGAGLVPAAAFPSASYLLAGVGGEPDVGLGEGGCCHASAPGVSVVV
jgi:hypothetical protein